MSKLILVFGAVLISVMGIAGYLVYKASLDVPKDSGPVAKVIEKEELSDADRDRLSAATVMLHVNDAGQTLHCAGFFCQNEIVVTDISVFGDVNKVSAFTGSIQVIVNSGVAGKQTILKGRLTAFDLDARLAFMKVTGTDLPAPLELGSAHDLRDNSPVYVSGFNWGKVGETCPVTVLNGSVKALDPRKSGTTVLSVNAPLSTGNRGAPVVDYKARVVGMAPGDLRVCESTPTVPPEDVAWSLSGHISNMALKTTTKNDTLYTFDVTAEVVNPTEKPLTTIFYYRTGSPGADMNALPLEYNTKSSTCKGSITALNIPRAGNLWTQTGVKLAENEEIKTNVYDRAAEIGVPGAMVAEIPLPTPQREAPRPVYRPVVVNKPAPPPPPPDSPGWGGGFTTDESSGQKSGQYETTQQGSGKAAGVINYKPAGKR